MRQTVRLTERELRHMISESIRRTLNENAVDDAIINALDSITTMDDVDGLGEYFGRRFNNNLMDALVEFIDGAERTAKDNKTRLTLQNIRNVLLGYAQVVSKK